LRDGIGLNYGVIGDLSKSSFDGVLQIKVFGMDQERIKVENLIL
jgi:hypothetical protein